METNNLMTPNPREMEKMNREIGALKERAERSKMAAKESFEIQLKLIEDQFDLIRAKMKKVSKQSEKVSEEVSRGISKAWSELKGSVDKASQYLH